MPTHKEREKQRARKFRLRIWARDGGCCVYCLRPVKFRLHLPRFCAETHKRWIFTEGGIPRTVLKASLHHLLDVCRGGISTMENLVLTCIQCNEARADNGEPFEEQEAV